jgi:hydrogenase nickel incorporation protein HypA/HybF
MHEVGIAAAIIEVGQSEVSRRPGSKLLRIGVRIGILSGVDHDALRFAFKALVAGTAMEPLDVAIEECQRRNRCQHCDRDFESSVFDALCPKCGSRDVLLIGGDELDVAFVELEDA